MPSLKHRTTNLELHNHLYPVIMAGGSGTRFWPLSRQLFPKQLLRIMGDETLIQQTMRRVVCASTPNHVIISTNPAQAESIRVQLSEWKDALTDNFVLEPEGRNTAPAIALVALELVRRDSDAIMVVVPADHIVKGQRDFDAAVSLASNLAAQGLLVTFGIQPIRPETGYGYIKPNRKTIHQTALFRGIEKIGRLMQQQASRSAIDEEYRQLPSVSIDTGVMEKSTKAAVVPVTFRWSDVGSWGSLDEVASKDKTGNVVVGRVVDIDSQRSIVYGDRRVVATIGLRDMVVVDTPDATLVCPKSRAQDVKHIVEILKQQGAPEHLEHLTVHRPWGSYTVLEEGSGYKVKRVTVNPGGRLSLQMHHKRSEHWVVIAGTARVTRGDEVFDLKIGHSTEIPVETRHRLENPGQETLHIIEVQNGPYLGEDDIVRFQDDYGRTKT
jgi:mannose-1-phosphate guanylyltransferase / mannose-6-phosphate isomerase